MIRSRTKLVLGTVAAVVVVGVLMWLVPRVTSPATGDVAKHETSEETVLRKAQALAVNEPTERNVRAWELAARKVRSQRKPWGNALVSVHATADDAIDANNFLAARAALTSGLSMSTSAPARQDLLQRLAWVELNLSLLNEARAHEDQAIALEDDERGYANALVVRHLIAVREGDQRTIDGLTEDLLHALDPN